MMCLAEPCCLLQDWNTSLGIFLPKLHCLINWEDYKLAKQLWKPGKNIHPLTPQFVWGFLCTHSENPGLRHLKYTIWEGDYMMSHCTSCRWVIPLTANHWLLCWQEAKSIWSTLLKAAGKTVVYISLLMNFILLLWLGPWTLALFWSLFLFPILCF